MAELFDEILAGFSMESHLCTIELLALEFLLLCSLMWLDRFLAQLCQQDALLFAVFVILLSKKYQLHKAKVRKRQVFGSVLFVNVIR